MSAGQNSSPDGMSYVARRKGDRLRVQGRESHVAFFRKDPTLSIPSSYHHHFPSTNLPGFRVLKLDSLFQRKTEEQGNRNRNKARSILTNMLNPFHYFIHEFNNQWVKMEDV